MIAFLQFLFALFLAAAGTDAQFDPGGAMISTALFAGGAVLVGRFLRGMVVRGEDERTRLGLVAGAANVGRLAALGTYWALVQRHGVTHLVDLLGVASWVLVPYVVALLPFFVLSAIVRTAIHPAAAAAGAAPPSLRASLALDAKMSLLPLAPVGLFAVAGDLIRTADRSTWWGRAVGAVWDLPSAQAFLILGVAVLGLLVLPTILRHSWRCRPLPPGPLRDRLEAYAARTGFRARDILVWPTGGEHVNAAVVGIAPPFRYVFVTDGLLETLSPDEIEAVFAHEAGHGRRGHMLLFFGYTGVFAMAGFLPGQVLGPLEAVVEPLPPTLRAMLAILLWLGLVFGWVSRRLEQEADVYGIETLPPPPRPDGTPTPPGEHPFARALERIAEVAGGIREVTGWRHFSIAQRTEFVRAYLTDPAVRRSYRRQILLLRGTLVVLVLVTAGFTAARIPFDIEQVRGHHLLEDLNRAVHTPNPSQRAAAFVRAAESARRSGQDDFALRWLREAVSLGSTPEALRDYALLLEEGGRPLGARAAWQALAARDDAPAALREAARAKAGDAPPAVR